MGCCIGKTEKNDELDFPYWKLDEETKPEDVELDYDVRDMKFNYSTNRAEIIPRFNHGDGGMYYGIHFDEFKLENERVSVSLYNFEARVISLPSLSYNELKLNDNTNFSFSLLTDDIYETQVKLYNPSRVKINWKNLTSRNNDYINTREDIIVRVGMSLTDAVADGIVKMIDSLLDKEYFKEIKLIGERFRNYKLICSGYLQV